MVSAVMLIATVSFSFQEKPVQAAQILERSLTLQTGDNGDGGSKPGGIVNHQFDFTIPTAGDVGSVLFEYCTIASGSTCDLPDGVVTTNAALGNETGATGFVNINNTANGSVLISRTAAAAVTAGQVVSYQLQEVTNPTTPNQTFFVRISTFLSIDGSGTAIDTGTVAASTANEIVLTGTMPESLIFCTGAEIELTAGIPDCSTATSGAIEFNQLFSPTDTATAMSKMAASTNATTGYTISVSGPTLTSGSNTIPAMGTAASGARGVGQFGMNLKANTTATSTVAVGNEVAPAANGIDLKGQATLGYDTVDAFKFLSGENVANSANGGAGPTNAQIFTASYIVNVPGSQPAGTYATTLTYVCTATF